MGAKLGDRCPQYPDVGTVAVPPRVTSHHVPEPEADRLLSARSMRGGLAGLTLYMDGAGGFFYSIR